MNLPWLRDGVTTDTKGDSLTTAGNYTGRPARERDEGMGPIEDHTMPLRAHQICNGLGAGNIGDELMARAFWDALPAGLRLTVDVFPNHTQQREPYPEH